MKSQNYAKPLKKLLYAIMLTVVLLPVSCRTTKEAIKVPIKTETKVIEKLVPVKVPADSTSIYALFKCDSLNRVIMTKLGEQKTSGMQSNFSFDGTRLTYKAKTIHDTIYVAAKDSFIYQEKPVKVPVEVNKLTWWQKSLCWTGGISLLLILAALGIRYRNIFKII